MSLAIPTLEVQLECYEGPLPVLIGLIKKNKVSIWDIPVASLTERFLHYVEIAQDLNLRIAEDFIEMASLLIFIKSKMLLPTEQNGNGEEEDPREELVERIIEYERLRNMAHAIDGLPVLDRDVFSIGSGVLECESEYDLLSLCSLYFELMEMSDRPPLTIRDIRPTLEEKLEMLRDILESAGSYEWDLYSEEDRNERVATILGMLELAKIRTARVIQRKPFGKILLKKRFLPAFAVTLTNENHEMDDDGYGATDEAYGKEDGGISYPVEAERNGASGIDPAGLS